MSEENKPGSPRANLGKHNLCHELGISYEEAQQHWKDVQYCRASGVTRIMLRPRIIMGTLDCGQSPDQTLGGPKGT